MIFLSRRPNLDPEPWTCEHGARFTDHDSAYDHSPGDDPECGAILDPRPEQELTRDPLPFANRIPGNRYPDIDSAAYLTGQRTPGDLYSWAPRRDEYDTPVNRVLALWREATDGDMRGWGVWLALAGADMLRDGDTTPAEIDHARKVLTRLANLRGE